MVDFVANLFSSVFAWIGDHEALVLWLAIFSAGIFLLSLLLIPFLIIRIPSDYFSSPGRYRSALFGNHPLALIILKMMRNSLGVFLVAVGVLLLFLPGQGLLMILLGVVIADFPGKHRLVNWLVSRQGVLRSINWLRFKAGKPPVKLQPSQR